MKKGGLYITLVPKVKGLNLCIIIGTVHQFFGSCLIPLDPCTLIKEKKIEITLWGSPATDCYNLEGAALHVHPVVLDCDQIVPRYGGGVGDLVTTV